MTLRDRSGSPVSREAHPDERERILSAFAVPTVLLGPEPSLRSARERGVYLRAQCRYAGLAFEDWPEEAQRVELEDLWRLLDV